MSNRNFFNESSEQSKVKSLIVSKYFWVWAKVIISTAIKKNITPKIAYIDLFAGPGRYKDGTKSTPIMILETAVKEPWLRDSLVTIFNDKNYSGQLKEAIDEIIGIGSLKHKPEVWGEEIDRSIIKQFKDIKLIPTLFFIDPWGYKGLSLELINAVLKDWGCDCIFFFNYNRINMGLTNDYIKEHINALFGEQRADNLRIKLEAYEPAQRELIIIEELSNALIEMGGKFTLPFVFKNESGKRTSHHLIFVSKNFKGYEIMKEIMAGESSKKEQGVASFGYNPSDINTPLLFDLSRPLDDLADMLLCTYAGKEITMKEIYLSHSIGKPYIACNYKSVLKDLEKENKITVLPPYSERRKIKGEVSLGDNVKIIFPELK